MTSRWIARAVAALSVLAAAAVAAPALADNYYLEIAGAGSLTPEPTEALPGVPPTWVKVTSFSFGVGHPQTIGSATGGAGAGKVTLESMTVTGVESRASQSLFQDATTGARVPLLRLVITRLDKGKQVPLEIVVMKDAYITSATMSASGPKPSDTFDINYAAVQYETVAPNGKTPTGETQLKWNQVLNRPATVPTLP